MADARLVLAGQMGILPGYRDLTGRHHETTVETAIALLAAMGVAADTEALARAVLDAPTEEPPEDVICTAGEAPALIPAGPWQLRLERGDEIEGSGPLPALPLGIHHLRADGRSVTLLAAPPRLPLPAPCWGTIAPLYGLAARGIGSYADLADLARGLGAWGAGFLGINPVHAGFPVEPGLFSPYTPSHRRRLNVMHLPGGRGSEGALIDYHRDIPERLAALRAAYDSFAGDSDFDACLSQGGLPLQRFALHQALSARHGPYWCDWPTELSAPDGAAAQAAAQELAAEIRFHAWLQWRAETELATARDAAHEAGMAHGLYLDLAVGTHPFGAETWEDRDSFASGASLGAPPDPLGPEGQNWNLAPFNPQALRARAYAPFAETLRSQLRFAGALRIDHVIGFTRAFWVPQGAPGAYVTMPRDALLAVTRIEAARAGAVIIGEDLGVLPEGLQQALSDSGILGCRVAMFERDDWQSPRFRAARDYAADTIASFSTHDLPTWRGWRAGTEIEARAEIYHRSPADIAPELASRAAEVAAFDQMLDTPDEDGLHDFLGRTGSRLVAAQAEIVLDCLDQPNLPGTVNEYPNWRRRLPVSARDFASDTRVATLARIMQMNGR